MSVKKATHIEGTGMNNIFVYGTLKRGEAAHKNLMSSATYLGPALTVTKFAMYSSGFPMIFLKHDGHYVEGEAYCVDDHTLVGLDRYEGVPSLYKRSKFLVKVMRDDGEIVELKDVWIYFRQNLDGFLRSGNLATARRVAPNDDGLLNWSEDERRVLSGYSF